MTEASLPAASPLETGSSSPAPHPLVAVDLGSNSFHMVVAQHLDGHIRLVDRIKDRVALAAGLDGKNMIVEEAQDRALACLHRFGQRLREIPAAQVRAVGTNTLRRARNSPEFLKRAREALGHPIEIISGQEEARLIYAGVCRDFQNDGRRRLVIDIGGGSTEVILGEGRDPHRMDSLYMGCVSYSRRFFDRGLSKAAFREARFAALGELRPAGRAYRDEGWEEAYGSSGTIESIESILRTNGWCRLGIDRKGLKKLRRALVEAGSLENLRIDGLAADRAPSLPGGLAILSACFDGLRLQSLRASPSALREGILTDLVGRMRHEDVRDLTVLRFCSRHQVDMAQAERTERWAIRAFHACREAWDLDTATDKQVLRWACRLHEIGLSLNYTGHHKHGAYLITHSYMAGFSRQEKTLLAALIGSHRRRIVKDRLDGVFDISRPRLTGLIVLLRLAVCLHRSRSPKPLPDMEFAPRADGLTLTFPPGWLEEHPLSRRDLDVERRALKPLGFALDVH